tara:strand:- start:1007 stop:2032 length:1026 start_codon:yes stop_codon:yes gene_type:complete
MKNIIFLCTADKKPFGGNKIIYQFSNYINSQRKFTSQVVHIKKSKISKTITSIKKKLRLESNSFTGWSIKDIEVAKNFHDKWFHMDILKKNDLNFKKDDFVIIPEIFAHLAKDILINKGIKFGIFVQNGYSIFSTNNYKFLDQAYAKSKMILSYSKDINDCVSMAFPKYKNKIIKVQVAIKSNKLQHGVKRNVITLMPRKLGWHAEQVKLFLRKHLSKKWKIKEINNLSETKTFNILKSSKLFLSFSSNEGLGLPPIEAAIAGNKVIGYTGESGKQWWKKPIFTEIYSGDIKYFCKEILSFTKKNINQKIFKTQRKKLINEFSEQNQNDSILKILKKVKEL